ncbi:MAG: Crp/Fnr family transcriptional regulator [Myxococcales bacterium]|nr:Crp/Fnr family transcriptional regulator [Myxococcales bacterium]
MPDYTRLLARIPLFQGLANDELASIAGLAYTRQFRPKQVVVRQSDAGGDMFIILEGHTKVVASDPEGKDTGLGIMGPEEVFGEVSLFDGAARSATIVAIDACQMLVIEQEPFRRFLEQHPRVAIRLLSVMARRLRQLTERSGDIAFRTVSARLAKAILQLADKYGRKEEDRVRVLFKLSQQDIGDLIGATRESANKHIRHWEQQGIMLQDSGHLVILDMERLREIAQGV